jgi:hypothetical protein
VIFVVQFTSLVFLLGTKQMNEELNHRSELNRTDRLNFCAFIREIRGIRGSIHQLTFVFSSRNKAVERRLEPRITRISRINTREQRCWRAEWNTKRDLLRSNLIRTDRLNFCVFIRVIRVIRG